MDYAMVVRMVPVPTSNERGCGVFDRFTTAVVLLLKRGAHIASDMPSAFSPLKDAELSNTDISVLKIGLLYRPPAIEPIVVAALLPPCWTFSSTPLVSTR